MNYSVFLYEIHTIMLPTLEEGGAVQFPKANFTLHLLNKKSPTSKQELLLRRRSACFHGITSYRAGVG